MSDIAPVWLFFIRKIIRYLFSGIFILLIVFLLPRLLPGDPIRNLVGEDIYLSPEKILSLQVQFGLDLPLHEQFINYCIELVHLDLGFSYHLNAPVTEIIAGRFVWTLLFIGAALILGAIIGIIIGARIGWQSESVWSRIIYSSALVISSVPPYLLGLLTLGIFVYHLGLFPFKGFYDEFTIQSIVYHLALPVLVLTLFYGSRNLIIMRGSVISEKNLLYPQFARSLGIPEKEILFRHIRRNALLPVIALIALDFGFLFSGALFVEIIFSLYGMGSLIYDAILLRDYPILTSTFLIISVLIIVANLIADLLSAILDPRMRSQR